MPQHPAAFVPGRAAAEELRAIARSLRLQSDGIDTGIMPDGRRKIIASVATVPAVQRFPASIDEAGNVSLPPLFVDFSARFYIPPRTERRRMTYSISWLRLVINATYTTDDAISASYPVHVSVHSLTFDWFDTNDGTLDPPMTSPDPVVSGTPVNYYFYLVKVNAGRIVTRAPSCYITGLPPTVPLLP